MNVTAVGPLPVGSLLWQRNGNWIQTVICKATFGLLPGESKLADEQEALNTDDAHLEDDPGRSMQAPSDLVPFKARAEVVLVGYAFAPRGEALRHLVVRLVVGEVDKAFEVVGDRAWSLDGTLREGSRFTRMPLRYERAGGGADTANPVGVSPDAPPDQYGMIPVPNLQPVGFVPSRPREVIAPIGFGPLSGTWPSRREKLGRLTTPPDSWDMASLPAELEPAYFNYAPRDQQVDGLRDNERLVLENLNPQHPRLVTNLPGVRPRAFADRGEGLQEVAMVCDTLWIDTGRGICTLTWRAYVESPPATGTVIVGMEGPERPLPWAEIQNVARRLEIRTEAPASAHTLPVVARSRQSSSADSGLPFGASAGPTAGAAGGGGGGGAKPSTPAWSRPSSPTSTLVRDGSTGSLRPEHASHTSPAAMSPTGPVPPEAQKRTYALPFAQPSRDPLVGTYNSEVSAAGDSSPAWLQGRSGLAPSPAFPSSSGAGGAGAAPSVPPPPVSFSAITAAPSAPPRVVPPMAVPAAPPMVAPPMVAPPLAAPVDVLLRPAPPPPPVVPAPVSPSGPARSSSPWAAGVPSSALPATIAPVVVAALRSGGAANQAGGAAASSDAAADANAVANAGSRSLAALKQQPAAAPAPASAPSTDKAARAAPTDVLDLIWYDEPHVPRIRAWWEELVTNLDFEPPDPRHDLAAENPEKARGRHNVFGVMTDADVIDTAGVSRVVTDAVNDKGRFTPPLALVGGELRFPFDEVETLRATIVAMTPLVGSDKRLKETIDSMSELLKTPYLQGSSGVVEKLTRELKDQFRDANRSLPAGFLDGHVERLLLEQRRYSIRKVFGGELIRALLVAPPAPGSASSSEPPIPVYLPKYLDQTLPMLVVMKARLIVEAHFQQDPYDASPYALRAVALARSFHLEGWRGGGGVASNASTASGGGSGASAASNAGKSAAKGGGDGERA
jgi:hypothetical protein